jgi:hypothetical protein
MGAMQLGAFEVGAGVPWIPFDFPGHLLDQIVEFSMRPEWRWATRPETGGDTEKLNGGSEFHTD